MVLKNNKKQKQTENSNRGHVGEDYISNLPDALIHHILSFLPTKSALSTCILSKRWNYVAITIPVLDFRHWRCKRNRKLETKLFMSFLDKVLYLHENPNIQEFHLGLDEISDEYRVYRWISTIMKRKVEILYLNINCLSTSSIFLLSFFTCDSLTLLDLDFEKRTVGKLIIPNTVSFPKLKILRLRSLSFVDETSTRKLFSNCPILEELRLSGCSVSEGLCILNTSLKHLSIASCELTESTVKISAPNLLTISYTGAPPADFVLDSFPSLVEARVGFYICGGSKYETFLKLFKTLSSVKVLKLCADSFLVCLNTLD
ncbi:hypothetical protein MKX03_014223 [Papaver bracteatum]|nr:hypothetical protein MKX03_014223 [Papaver bracteatum]